MMQVFSDEIGRFVLEGGQMGGSNNLFLYTGDDWKDCPMDRWHLGTPIFVPTEVNENYT